MQKRLVKPQAMARRAFFCLLHRALPVVLLVAGAYSVAATELVLITELHRDPAGLESTAPGGLSHEFIEIYNAGTTPLNLDSLFLSDGADSDPVVPIQVPIAGHGECLYATSELPPGGFALILDPDYAATVHSFPHSRFAIAPGTVLWTIDTDATLGNGLAATDGVVLYRGTSQEIARVVAVAADSGWEPVARNSKLDLAVVGGDGVSVVLGSFLLNYPVYEPCVTGSSPGSWEQLKGTRVLEWTGVAGNNGSVRCTIAVLTTADTSSVQTHYTCVSRGESATKEVLLVNLGKGPVGEDLLALNVWPEEGTPVVTARSGSHEQRFELDLSRIVVVGQSVLITEICPRASTQHPEWIELFNPTQAAVTIKGWQLETADRSELIAGVDLSIGAGRYLVLCADTAKLRPLAGPGVALHKLAVWPTLDNYHDTLRLRSATGVEIESVCYHSNWFPEWEYQSLERIVTSGQGCASNTWALANRQSPGVPNLGQTWRAAPRNSLSIGPVPFSPNGDRRDDYLAIELSLVPGSSALVTIIGFDGTVYRQLPADESPVVWDGRRADGSVAPVGPFFVVAEISASGGALSRLRSRGVLWR